MQFFSHQVYIITCIAKCFLTSLVLLTVFFLTTHVHAPAIPVCAASQV